MVSPLVSVPRIYHQKAMECARRVDRHWGKGTEVYLFCTEKGAKSGARDESYNLVRNESSTCKHY